MSDETGIRFSVLYCVSGCYAEVHISWESFIMRSLKARHFSCIASEIIDITNVRGKM